MFGFNRLFSIFDKYEIETPASSLKWFNVRSFFLLFNLIVAPIFPTIKFSSSRLFSKSLVISVTFIIIISFYYFFIVLIIYTKLINFISFLTFFNLQFYILDKEISFVKSLFYTKTSVLLFN